ncbi:MAG: hypothetical protein A2X36_03265 [Elusimicrobia bacterium GWA2_69_24]|nr:MAG: hypothetical protein A2X36_03265 [Elusimicrobia bacterium GWA2_69_24]
MARNITLYALLATLPLSAETAAARMEDRTEELYRATEANDLTAVGLILKESDQNVNVAWDDNDTSPLMLACRAGNEKMARLLISKGADITAVDADGRPVAEFIPGGNTPAYRRLRQLLAKTAEEKKLSIPPAWQEIFVPDGQDGRAVSTDPEVLSAANIADGNTRTAWAAAGGIGAELWVFISSGARSVNVVNGYGKSQKLFKANNRVKKLSVSLWTAEHFDGDVTETGRGYRAARLTPDRTLDLKDSLAEQAFPFPFKWEEARSRRAEAVATLIKRPGLKSRKLRSSAFFLRAEPLEIYPGSRYNDTCISELGASRP